MKRYLLILVMMVMSVMLFADNTPKGFSTESLKPFLKKKNISNVEKFVVVIKQYETSESLQDAAEKDEHVCTIDILEEYKDFAVANIEIKKDDEEVLKDNFSLIKKDGQWLVSSVVYAYETPTK